MSERRLGTRVDEKEKRRGRFDKGGRKSRKQREREEKRKGMADEEERKRRKMREKRGWKDGGREVD